MAYRQVFAARNPVTERLPKGWIADAMAMAREMKGENVSVTVIPDGVSVIVRKN